MSPNFIDFKDEWNKMLFHQKSNKNVFNYIISLTTNKMFLARDVNEMYSIHIHFFSRCAVKYIQPNSMEFLFS